MCTTRDDKVHFEDISPQTGAAQWSLYRLVGVGVKHGKVAANEVGRLGQGNSRERQKEMRAPECGSGSTGKKKMVKDDETLP